MARPFAVFDIDGTIIRWQLYHAVADKLAQEGLVEPGQFKLARDARMTWKRRTHSKSFIDYEETLVRVLDKAMQQIPYDDYLRIVHMVFEEYKDQTYTYTRDLISSLKERGYLLFAISASQIEVVELLADYYGFDDWGGSRYEIQGGHFTGHKDVLFRGRKPELLEQLVAKHQATYSGSIAVGDSESDIPMLQTVEQPIAFNPTQELFITAQANGWQIVIERKNMVYELVAEQGSYKLRNQ